MWTKRFLSVALAISFALGAMSTSQAQESDVLLKLLVKKGLITQKDADDVRSELKKKAPPATKTVFKEGASGKEVTVTPASATKWKLSLPLTEIELYGDARLRYEYRGGQTSDVFDNAHDDWQERKRERYRLRLGLRGTLTDDWFFGVRLETSSAPRSTNVTFGDDSQVNGPFSKDSDRINVGQAYLGYKGFKDITLTGGRMQNPLVSTWMVWDADINPEGLAEQWKHTFELGGGSSEPATQGYTKDGMPLPATKTASDGFKMKIDVFANFGQFVYDDTNPENPLGSRPRVSSSAGGGTHQTGELIPNTDAFLLAWQVGAKFTFPNNIYAQVAPTLYNYTGNGDSFNIHFQGGDPTLSNADSMAQNQTGINSLLVFDLPWEIGWKLGELPMHLFGDFAVNLDADDRAEAAGFPDKDDQRWAYQVGVGVGKLKSKHDWQIDVFWQHNEQYSLDPNLIDNDIFDARLNMEGVGVRAGYALTDAIFFNLEWVYGWRIDDDLGTGGFNDIGINPLDHYQILQTDLTVKF